MLYELQRSKRFFSRDLIPLPVLFVILISCILPPHEARSQSGYGSAAAYGLRKLNPSYTGNAIRVRRLCDNATQDIGFSSCGDLDTTALKTFIVAGNPLSSIVTGAATAFSLRRLTCTYSGNAIRVRSSASGSPTLDIGFTANGDLDTASLKTFIGTNSAFVTTWYDQSGNGRNATQTVTTAQPRIMNAGTIDRQNSMPAIRWLGISTSMATAPFTAYGLAACFNGVAKVNADLSYNTIVNKTNSNIPAPIDFYNAQGVLGNGSLYSFVSTSQTFSSSQPLGIWTMQFAITTNYNYYYNGSSIASGNSLFYGDTGNKLSLGSREDGLTGLDGWISEVITFASFPSTTERQYLEWSQSQYYSISGLSLSSLPFSPGSAYVSIWYDQSGNGLNATQTATASQPRIVNTGVIDKNGTRPAIYFEGYPENLVAPLSTSVYPISISLLANTGGSSSGGAFVKHGTSTTGTDGGVAIGIGNSGGNYDVSGTSVIGLKEWVVWCPSSPNVSYPSTSFVSTTIQQASGTMSTYVNGTAIPLSNATTAVGSTMSGSLYIGGYVNSANRYPVVKESEVIVFASALTTAKKTMVESDQAAYYGLTVTGTKYSPPSSGIYNRFTNGVGRESATDTIQGTRTTKGLGISVGKTASDFLKDNGDYMTFAMDCPITSSIATTFTPATVVQRWGNDWYLNKTDVSANSGTVNLFFDFGDYGVPATPGTASNYELLSRTSTSSNFSIVSATTKSVSGLRVYFTLDASNLSNNSYYTIGTKNSSLSPLPIGLSSFDALCSENAVNISWSTETEFNNDYFLVERTTDGSNFEPLGKVNGAGTSSHMKHYRFTDEQPLAGSSYYRLRQTDFDGSIKYFKLASVFCKDQHAEIKVYPNPGNTRFTIEGVAQNNTISIFSLLGTVVWEQKSTSLKQNVDAAGWPEGVYFIQAGEESPVVKKIVIHH